MSNRTKVIKLLAETRLHELSVPARAAIIDALMNMRLRAHGMAEEWVTSIILHTKGRQLTLLKTACDAKGTATNLHKLIFHEIHSEINRFRILSHIKTEAESILQEYYKITRRKILSDVDDTLFSSGGRFPAGIDIKFNKHVLYPGVLSFYKELDLGVDESGEWEEGRLGNLTFLSARPHVYKDKSESKSYQIFESLITQKTHPMHCMPTLLAGSLDSGIKMFRGEGT